MPIPTIDLFLPSTETGEVDIALEPAHNAIYSLSALVHAEHQSGLDMWVYETAAALTDEERKNQALVMSGLHYAAAPTESWSTFPLYLDHLASVPPEVLRDKVLDAYRNLPCRDMVEVDPAEMTTEIVLADVNAFLSFLRERFEPKYFDEAVERQSYTYLMDPPALQQLVVGHLRHMWHKYLAVEWERVRPMLQEAVAAFRRANLSEMSRSEAADFIVGGDQYKAWWDTMMQSDRQLTFVPSAHSGPYFGKFFSEDHYWVIFGARQPEGVEVDVPELSRAEILVRLNALADDTRLAILHLVAEQGELRSQDIIDQLQLSQSAASRHLKQLSATGLLSARRCNGAKCYDLNSARIGATLDGVANYLLVREAVLA